MVFDWQELIPRLRAVMESEVLCGRECGCQLAIYDHGTLTVDLAAGSFGAGEKRQVASSTLFPLFSAGKALLATAVLQAVEAGVFSLDTPVAEVWPEFAANGKAGITVEHILSHRAGLTLLPHMTSDDEFADWELMCSRIAAMTPRSAPGKICRYHPLTFGYLAGNLLVRALHAPLRDILLKQVICPAGIENEFFFGLSDAELPRLVPVDDGAYPPEERPSWYSIKMNNPVLRRACLPAFAGCGTARALARFYAALNGDLTAPPLLKRETLEMAACRLWRDPADAIAPDNWFRFGLGFLLDGPQAGGSYRYFGHGGAAGAEGFYDRISGIAVGFAKNRALPTHPDHPIRSRLSEVLEIPERHW